MKTNETLERINEINAKIEETKQVLEFLKEIEDIAIKHNKKVIDFYSSLVSNSQLQLSILISKNDLEYQKLSIPPLMRVHIENAGEEI